MRVARLMLRRPFSLRIGDDEMTDQSVERVSRVRPAETGFAAPSDLSAGARADAGRGMTRSGIPRVRRR
jgi:hypothetical protein